jgi:DNA-binding MarR family transcriptional regulator
MTTRWLDDDELEAWIRLVGLLMFLPPHLEESLQEHGLTFFDYSIMAALSDAPDGRLAMSYLAGLTHGSLSRLSHAIKRLESRGVVRREASPDDARVTVAVLTEEGRSTMAAAAPDHVASVRAAVFDALDGEQVAQLHDICAAVVARVRPDVDFRRPADDTPAN